MDLLNLISPKIVIDVSKNYFIFKRGEKILELQTFIYIADENDKFKVVSVSEEPTFLTHGTKINLFENNIHIPNAVDKTELLKSFIVFAIKELMPKMAIVRPTLIFKNINSLEQVFTGYQKSILRFIGEYSGAAAVYFED